MENNGYRGIDKNNGDRGTSSENNGTDKSMKTSGAEETRGKQGGQRYLGSLIVVQSLMWLQRLHDSQTLQIININMYDNCHKY